MTLVDTMGAAPARPAGLPLSRPLLDAAAPFVVVVPVVCGDVAFDHDGVDGVLELWVVLPVVDVAGHHDQHVHVDVPAAAVLLPSLRLGDGVRRAPAHLLAEYLEALVELRLAGEDELHEEHALRLAHRLP
eukprot:CAMPEP_0179357904 /NCGR_PEP_ID=MMETSP0797-20121207/78648_1 /TAXON_ID=47934 /ORGANISM="Dinophysis acuminata, Strain DAEP01" /LENGTH=130 /DNA_ID=CAMNT_0021073135 /DNA_START=85 /DNA_END=474 /DNA_ORIENTATION=+